MKTKIVPVCQVEDCAKPIHDHRDRAYLWVKGPHDLKGRQIIVCRSCEQRFKTSPTETEEKR